MSRIGLALAGGGPEGAVYEIGALRALEECLEGADLTELDVYVGVSAGSFVASLLANGVTPAQMCRAVARHEPRVHPLTPATFFTPAARAWLRGGAKVPALFLEALTAYARHPDDLSLLESLTCLARALPIGLFDNRPIRSYLESVLALHGRTNDFRDLPAKLIVVAADVDAATAVRFGDRGWDDVPISVAVQASTALPILYSPVKVRDRWFADGVLIKTLHASVALDDGAGLLFCVNPIVPVDIAKATEAGRMPRGRLAEIGLPAVLSQAFRTLIHSRLQLGFAGYDVKYPDRDIFLIEPERDDYAMFFTNIFSFSDRRTVLEHAWRSTRRWLSLRREALEPILARHGVGIRRDVLEDEKRDFWVELGYRTMPTGSPLTAALDELLTRIEKLEAERGRRPGRRAPTRPRKAARGAAAR